MTQQPFPDATGLTTIIGGMGGMTLFDLHSAYHGTAMNLSMTSTIFSSQLIELGSSPSYRGR